MLNPLSQDVTYTNFSEIGVLKKGSCHGAEELFSLPWKNDSLTVGSSNETQESISEDSEWKNSDESDKSDAPGAAQNRQNPSKHMENDGSGD